MGRRACDEQFTRIRRLQFFSKKRAMIIARVHLFSRNGEPTPLREPMVDRAEKAWQI